MGQKLDLVTPEQLKEESAKRFFLAMGLPPLKEFFGFRSPILSLEEIAERLITIDPKLSRDKALKQAEETVAVNRSYTVRGFRVYHFQEFIDRPSGKKYYRLQE